MKRASNWSFRPTHQNLEWLEAGAGGQRWKDGKLSKAANEYRAAGVFSFYLTKNWSLIMK